MYMSEIIMMSEDMGMKWHMFPLDKCPSLNIHWEYGVCYPLGTYFNISPDDSMVDEDDEEEAMQRDFKRKLSRYAEGMLYMNPDRHSMMFYVVDPLFDGDDADNDEDAGLVPYRMRTLQGNECTKLDGGGPTWKPRIHLAHEFSLLPFIEPFSTRCKNGTRGKPQHPKGGLNNASSQAEAPAGQDSKISSIWGGVTAACSSVLDMQNRLFKLGFGPHPFFRRAGVLLNISPNQDDDDEPSKYMLGCIVAHTCGVHGCRHDSKAIALAEGLLQHRNQQEDSTLDHDDDDAAYVPEDMRCYFCTGNPFFEVLFENHEGGSSDTRRPGDGIASPRIWETVPVTSSRACFRAVPVGTKLLLTVGVLRAIIPSFQTVHQTHVAKKVKAQFIEEHSHPFFGSSNAADSAELAGPMNHVKQRARRMRTLMMSLSAQQPAAAAAAAAAQSACDTESDGGGGMLSSVMENTARGKAALHQVSEHIAH
jgi:hypothetical protein